LGDNYLRSGFVVCKDTITSSSHSFIDNREISLYQLLLQLTSQWPLVGLIHKPLFVEQNDEITERDIQAEFQGVTEELSRRSVIANVAKTSIGSRRIQRQLFGEPLVSIIIPTGSQRRVINGSTILLVEQCVNSILKKSTYEHFEIVIVHDQRSTINHSLMELAIHQKVRVIPFSQEFNFADKCNLGFVASAGQFVIFLNDDTEIISEDWIETLIGHLQDIGVGMSGPTLLLEDGRIQSASLCNNPAPHNYGAGLSVKDFYSVPHNQIAREVSGLTGACIAIRREVYTEVGGMCSEFPNNFNDIDLCSKLLYKNYRIIWTPFAHLTHFEAQSRDPSVSEDESQRLRLRWGRFFNNDKFTPV
jgi:GT2 family glycosyltransferase